MLQRRSPLPDVAPDAPVDLVSMEGVVVLESGRAIRLARELRELRESQWPEEELTQAQLAKAFSGENKVAPATLSSWESLTNPKTPPRPA